MMTLTLTGWVRVVRVAALLLPLITSQAYSQAPRPATARIVVAPAETLAVHERGFGDDVVVIVPSLLGSDFGFRHVIADLEDRHTHVYIVDLLGFGSSSRPKGADYSFGAQAARLQAVLDSVGAANQNVVLLCHALAGAVCYRAIHADPTIRALVSLNGAPAESPKTSGVSAALKFGPVLRLFGAQRIARGKIRSGLTKSSIDPSWLTDDVLAAYLAPFRGDVFSVLGMLKRMEKSHEAVPMADVLPAITVPVELLVSRTPEGSAMRDDELAALQTIPGIVVTQVDDAGQYIQEENPGAVTAAVLRALVRPRALLEPAPR